MKGTVVWFNAAKGYGFLRAEDTTEVFVHHTAIVAKGYRELKKDQAVEFEIIEGQKGPQAENVTVVK